MERKTLIFKKWEHQKSDNNIYNSFYIVFLMFPLFTFSIISQSTDSDSRNSFCGLYMALALEYHRITQLHILLQCQSNHRFLGLCMYLYLQLALHVLLLFFLLFCLFCRNWQKSVFLHDCKDVRLSQTYIVVM